MEVNVLMQLVRKYFFNYFQCIGLLILGNTWLLMNYNNKQNRLVLINPSSSTTYLQYEV